MVLAIRSSISFSPTSLTSHFTPPTLVECSTNLAFQTLLHKHTLVPLPNLTFELKFSCKTCGMLPNNLLLKIPPPNALFLSFDITFQPTKPRLNFPRPLIYNLLHIHIFQQEIVSKALLNLCKGQQVKFDLESAFLYHYRQQTQTTEAQTYNKRYRRQTQTISFLSYQKLQN